MMKNINVASQFPLAKLHGTISPELTRIWELHICARKRQETQPIPLYEKVCFICSDWGCYFRVFALA